MNMLDKQEGALDTANEEMTAEQAGGDGNQEAGKNIEQIDMAEAERIATEREERATRGALTSYFKQQGLSEEEVKQALEAYKARQAETKAAARNDLTQLQAQYDALEKEKQAIMVQANQRLVRSEAMMQALSMQIRPDRIEHVIRLADLSAVGMDEHGQPDKAAISAALEAVVSTTPEFKATSGADEEGKPGFKIGASDQQQQMKDAELAKIFKINN
jgi:hypothetical protein